MEVDEKASRLSIKRCDLMIWTTQTVMHNQPTYLSGYRMKFLGKVQGNGFLYSDPDAPAQMPGISCRCARANAPISGKADTQATPPDTTKAIAQHPTRRVKWFIGISPRSHLMWRYP